MNGKEIVRTVLGDIEPSDCGITLPHEHLSMNYEKCTVASSNSAHVSLNEFRLQDMHWIYMNPYSHPFNLKLEDEPLEDIIKEVLNYKELGGKTIVENTVTGISNNVEKLALISKQTDTHIIAGTGLYLDITLDVSIKTKSVEELVSTMLHDLYVGTNGSKCGLIGEIGTSWPITKAEKKNLEAAALAQQSTGAPVMIHPGRDVDAPFESLRIYQEAGGDVQKCAMAHLDRTLFTLDRMLELAASGCFLEFDHFGIEISYYQNNPKVDMPSDAERLCMIQNLIKEGKEEQILMSHDVHTRHRLSKYGGHGFGHLLANVVPKMLSRNISAENVNKVIRSNPQRWLSFLPINAN